MTKYKEYDSLKLCQGKTQWEKKGEGKRVCIFLCILRVAKIASLKPCQAKSNEIKP